MSFSVVDRASVRIRDRDEGGLWPVTGFLLLSRLVRQLKDAILELCFFNPVIALLTGRKNFGLVVYEYWVDNIARLSAAGIV